MRCINCKEDKEVAEIYNYVVEYESWEAYNCCCKECAKKSAMMDGIQEDEIINIKGG